MISTSSTEVVPYIKDIFKPPCSFKDLKPKALIIADGLYTEILQTLGRKPCWVITESTFIPASTAYDQGMMESDCWDLLERELCPIPNTTSKKICYRFAFKLIHKGELVHGVEPLVLWNFHFDGSADYEQKVLDDIILEQLDQLSKVPLPKHAVNWEEYIDVCSEVVHV